MGRDNRLFWAMLLQIALFTLGSVYLWVIPEESAQLALPLFVAILGFTAFYSIFVLKERDTSIFDAGVLTAFAIFLYTAIPLAGLLLNDMVLVEHSDNRLIQHLLTPESIASLGWRYVTFLLSFMFFYWLARRKIEVPMISSASRPNLLPTWLIVFLVMATAGYSIALRLFTGVDLDVAYDNLAQATDAYSQLPLFLRQITGHSQQAAFALKLGVLYMLFQNYNRSKNAKLIIWSWLAFEIAISVSQLGSRTGAVLLILAAILLYHRTVKSIFFGKLSFLAASVFLWFYVHGMLRHNISLAEISLASIFVISSEFQSLFGTSYDILMFSEDGSLVVPWQIYLADLLRLVPSQMLPFEKIEPAEWYLSLIGYENQGVGLTFGTIAEAILGYDWIELILRGAVLATLLGWIHRWFQRNSDNDIVFLAYLWLCVKSYMSIRASTFYLLSTALYQLVPALILFSWAVRRYGKIRTAGVPVFSPARRPAYGGRGRR